MSYSPRRSYDKSAKVWDARSGTVLKTFDLHTAPVLDVDWRDSEQFVTCSSDKYLAPAHDALLRTDALLSL